MRQVIAVLLIVFAAMANAETKVWLIGGGNTLGNSQGQIEENVRWMQRILNARGIQFRTYFTSGTKSAVDVIYYAPPGERDPYTERILRVFGEDTAYASRTKRNTLERIDGTTEKAALIESLKGDFANVGPDDSVLIVYNGHGDADFSNTTRNSLKLWGDGRLSLSEFAHSLDEVNPRATVRVVMTQCFSGAFAGVALPPPDGINATAQRRCGYFAESDIRESEGCDLGINQEEFRDYTTYFIAALTGRTRLGGEIPMAEVDTDGSGFVSFDEAHYYTLKHGVNSDLPRSTREVSLEKGEPWYLRWNSFAKGSEDNRYRSAARHIAQRDGFPVQGQALVKEAFRRQQLRSDQERRVEATSRQIRQIQSDLRARVIARYPETAGQLFWKSLAHRELEEVGRFIAELDGFGRLIAEQDRQVANMEKLLADKRAEAQADRVLWLNRVARLERYVAWLPAATRRQLELLEECEKGQL